MQNNLSLNINSKNVGLDGILTCANFNLYDISVISKSIISIAVSKQNKKCYKK